MVGALFVDIGRCVVFGAASGVGQLDVIGGAFVDGATVVVVAITDV